MVSKQNKKHTQNEKGGEPIIPFKELTVFTLFGVNSINSEVKPELLDDNTKGNLVIDAKISIDQEVRQNKVWRRADFFL